MKRRKWLKMALNEAFNYLIDNYRVNSGGCCYLAYVVAEKLDSLGIEYSLVVYNEAFSKNSLGINFSNEAKETCSHYTLKVKGLGIINKGIFDGYKKRIVKNISSNQILHIYSKGEWNECYDREDNSRVYKFINLIFDLYEKTVSKSF